jgi:hypothetical protein
MSATFRLESEAMKTSEERHLISKVLGRGMRRERQRRGKTLGDVGVAAGAVGITWDPSAVSRIELDLRILDIEEFAALPVIMTLALGEPITYADLFNLDGVEDGDAIVAVGRLAPWLAETQRAVWPGEEWDRLREFVVHDVGVAAREVQAAAEPDEETSTLEEIQGFADRLDMPVAAVMDAIHDLVEMPLPDGWVHHSPRAEREHRLAGRGEDLSQVGRIRVLRGHITRELEREIAEKLKEQGHGVDHESGERLAGEVADTRGR